MTTTNAITAQAATQTARATTGLRLLGVFQNTTNDFVLLRDGTGAMIRLSKLIPVGDLRLIDIYDDFVLVQDGRTIRRLFVG